MIHIRLIHGECLEEMDKLIAEGVKVDMILCDLPYGTTQCKWDTIIPFKSLWQQYERIIKDNGVIALFADEPFSATLIVSNMKMYRYELIWQKEQGTDFLNANRKPLKAHEKIQIFYKKQPTYNKQYTEGKPYRSVNGGKKSTECYGDFKMGYFKSLGDKRNPISVLQFNRERGLHPTQKPVALCE